MPILLFASGSIDLLRLKGDQIAAAQSSYRFFDRPVRETTLPCVPRMHRLNYRGRRTAPFLVGNPMHRREQLQTERHARGKIPVNQYNDASSESLLCIDALISCFAFGANLLLPALAVGFADETMAPKQGQRGRNTLQARILGYENLFDTPDTDETYHTGRPSTGAAFVNLPCGLTLSLTFTSAAPPHPGKRRNVQPLNIL